MADTRWFLIWPSGDVEEVDDDGPIGSWDGDGLYDQLVFAGYPLHHDRGDDADDSARWTGVIDVRVEDGHRVIGHTTGPQPLEHIMPLAEADLFLAWMAAYA